MSARVVNVFKIHFSNALAQEYNSACFARQLEAGSGGGQMGAWFFPPLCLGSF